MSLLMFTRADWAIALYQRERPLCPLPFTYVKYVRFDVLDFAISIRFNRINVKLPIVLFIFIIPFACVLSVCVTTAVSSSRSMDSRSRRLVVKPLSMPLKQGSDLIELRLTWKEMEKFIFDI